MISRPSIEEWIRVEAELSFLVFLFVDILYVALPIHSENKKGPYVCQVLCLTSHAKEKEKRNQYTTQKAQKLVEIVLLGLATWSLT